MYKRGGLRTVIVHQSHLIIAHEPVQHIRSVAGKMELRCCSHLHDLDGD